MFQDLQYIKTRASLIRQSYIEEMEKNLLAFEQKLTNANICTVWVQDEEELVSSIIKSFKKPNNNKICIDLKQVPKYFLEKKSTFKSVSVPDFSNFSDFAEHLVVEANFGIVENGSLILIDKSSKSCFNRVENLHIVLDINNLIIKQNDLEPLLFLHSRTDGNYSFPKDVKILNGEISQIYSNQIYSSDSKFETRKVKTTLYYYDNGISNILADPILRESLYCIDCGRCKEVCPVFKQTQKYTPIDLVINNFFEENRRTTQIFENTTLCGNCNEVCPVLIPLTDLMIYEMQTIKNKHSREKNIDLFKYFSKRIKMNKLNNWFAKYFFIKKQYKKNKKLSNYIKQQKLPFFNITFSNKNTNVND